MLIFIFMTFAYANENEEPKVVYRKETNIDLHIIKYNILPITTKEGVIEMIPNAITLYELKKRPVFNPLIIHVNSFEMTEKIATAINKRIDIPFVSEDKEQIFFEKMVDVVTDILEGVFKGK